MIGLEFICNVFDMQYKEVAQKIGVSNQTITDWIKGKTSKIPDRRLNDLVTKIPEFSSINRELFSKVLTPLDKQNIATTYVIQDVKRMLEESLNIGNVEGLKTAIELTENAQGGLITSVNLKSLILIADHLIDNREFMDDLADLIIRYAPSLEKELR